MFTNVAMRRVLSCACGAGLLLTAAAAPAAQVQYVIAMTLDGLGAKYLQLFVSNAPAQYPNFRRLMAEGSYTFNARCDYDISVTVPNHISIITGRPVSSPASAPLVPHGYTADDSGTTTTTIHNAGNTSVPYKASFFDVAHDYGFSTAMYLGKSKLQICERSYNATNGAQDTNTVAGDNGRAKIDTYVSGTDYFGTNGVSNLVNAALQNFTNATPKRCNLLHLAEPDMTGHSYNWRSAQFSNMVAFIDTQLGRIIAAISNNPVLSNNTALLITADHGGGGITINHHIEAYHVTNYTIPFFAWGPGFRAGADVYEAFANRGNPGTNRIDYSIRPQPLRNCDMGNVAMALLGLPPIPDSFVVPVLGATNMLMSAARATNGTTTMWWPDSSAAFILQSASALGDSSQWQTITTGIVDNGGIRMYSTTNDPVTTFYRLKKL